MNAKAEELLTDKDINFYTLYYHYRASRPLEFIFIFEGDLKKAVTRGRRHCEAMNYRFIKVRPTIVDLDDRERRKNEAEGGELAEDRP
jgi:hypothetical protein